MKPFYSVKFNARMCNMKISVNGIPFLVMEVDGQCSSGYPFNNLLLESGWASIRYEARPLKGELQLRKDAYLCCKVELYDMESINYQPISTMADYETPQQKELLIPYIMHEDTFLVDLPYYLIGWEQSLKLNQFKEKLRLLVLRKYNHIISIMRNHYFSQFENEFRERENIIGVCYFLSKNEKQDRMKEVEDAIINCSEIVPLSSTDRLEFAAEGRLVRLVKEDGESALRIRNDVTGEETTIDLWLHMKTDNSELTII